MLITGCICKEIPCLLDSCICITNAAWNKHEFLQNPEHNKLVPRWYHVMSKSHDPLNNDNVMNLIIRKPAYTSIIVLALSDCSIPTKNTRREFG